MRPRPSLTMALESESVSRTDVGHLTNRTLAKSVYSPGGFHTTKNRDIKLNIDTTARRSVIEFPNYNEQQTT